MSIKRSLSKVKSKLKLSTGENSEASPISPISIDSSRIRNSSFSSINSANSSNYKYSSHSQTNSISTNSIINTIPHSVSLNSIHLIQENQNQNEKLIEADNHLIESKSGIPELNLLPPVPHATPSKNADLSPTTLKSLMNDDDILSLNSIKLIHTNPIQRPSTSMSNYSKNSLISDMSCSVVNDLSTSVTNLHELHYNGLQNDEVCDAMAISILSKINNENQIKIVDNDWCI